MPRKLPWETSKKVSSSQKSAHTPRPNKRPRVDRSPASAESDAPVVYPRRQDEFNKHYPGVTGASSRARSPSTSPPPAPPEINLMRDDGHDDAWIMVEDEFMSTAQTFTRHLHHAAYKERKLEAASRAAAATALGGSKDSANTKHVVVEKIATRNGIAIERPGSEEAEEGDDMIIGDRRLAGLMFGQGLGGKSKTRLEALVPSTGNDIGMRAAIGCVDADAGTEDSSDDDLDVRPRHPRTQKTDAPIPPLTPTPDARHSAHVLPPSKPSPSVAGLGSSIFGSAQPRSSTEARTSPQFGVSTRTSTMQTLDFDSDGMPLRRPTLSLAELRKARAAGKRRTETMETPMRSPQALPQGPAVGQHGLSSPTLRFVKTKQVRKELPDTHEVVPLFLD